MANQSDVFEFILIGFPGLPQKFHFWVSLIMFLVYNIALLGNGTVIVLLILRKHLHQPMYIIICNLAFSDLVFDTITLPKMIATYWFGAGSLTFSGCMIQLFMVHLLGGVDSFVIMLMAIDRYIAICNPLRYSSLISNTKVFLFLFFSWISAALVGFTVVGMNARLPFCGPNKVKSCFCSQPAVTVLACTDVSFVRRLAFYLAMFVHTGTLAVIILTYIIIIKTIHTSSSSDNWQKAFYTCTTHLFVIGLHFVPRMLVYSTSQVPITINGDLTVLLLCLYTYVPHMTNPIIYCLRTQEIRATLGSVLKGRLCIKTKDLQVK